MLKNLADLFRGLFGRRHRKTDAAVRRRHFLNQFRKGRMEGLEDRSLMAAFTEGNLAVLVSAASANNTTGSVVEINTTSAGQSAIQTFAIPDTGVDAYRMSGSATSTGYVSRSNDRTLLTFTGHNSTTTGVNANTLNPRGVFTYNNAGDLSKPTTYTGSSGNQTRSATTLNGTDWFIADQGGIYTNGATAASPTANVRGIKSFGGTVYVGQASSTTTVIQLSTVSAPTGGTITGVPGLTNLSSFQDFYLISSGENGSSHDVMYVLGATSNTAGTIYKYSALDTNTNGIFGDAGDSWTANGTYTTTFGGFGLAASDSGAGASLYVTTGQGALTANSVLKLTDAAGYNATIDITTGNNVTLFTAATGTILKGLDFVPVAGAPTVTSPTSTNITDTTATLGGNVTAGTGIVERGIVYSLTSANADPVVNGSGVTKVIEGGTTTGVFTTSVNGLTASSGYSFKAYAINANGTSYSPVATFTTNAPAAAHQAPSGTDNTITLNEDATHTFSAANFPFTDNENHSLNRVRISTLPALGTLTLGGNAVNAGDFIAAAAIPTLVYTPVANGAGTGYTTFTFQVEDTGSTANGGQILDATPNTITFNVTGINDAPAGTDKTVSATTASGYTFTAADFGFTDPLDTPANTLLAVKVASLPAAGTLTNDNVAVSANDFIPVADITGGKLKFTPAVGATPGVSYATFTFQVQDNGGTANGGVDLDASPNTITIDLMLSLAAGDIAFTAFQADNTGGAGGDFFEFVALRDLPAGTTIYFVDSPFNGTAFQANESAIRWVAQSAVTAGSTFSFTATGGSNVPNTPEWTGISPTTGNPTANASFGLSTSGESIHALFSPTFGGTNALTGTAIAAIYFGEEPATLPSGLVLGENAVSVGNFDNGRYNPDAEGSVESGPIGVVRASINTAANWVTSEEPLSPHASSATFTIVTAPEINVQGGGLNIADGDTTSTTADGTDFGAAVQGGAPIDRTFTIQNLGSQPLVLSGGPNFVTVTGGSNFSILTQPASGTIAAGGSATFVVRMTPTTIATQTATVTITSDDADEGTYDFAVTSVVTATAAATSTSLNTVTPLNAAAGDSITFAGTVVAGSGTATPIGTVEIRDGGASGTLLASTTTIGGTGVNGTFNIVSTTVPAGAYSNIQAFFVPGAGFLASNSSAFSGTLEVVAAATYVGYSTAGATYSQNFDSLINTGTVSLTGNGPFHLADPQFATTPITGWYFSKYAGTGSNALFRVDDGAGTSGSIYSYGAASSTDRALGSLASGSTISRFGAVIRNTTGSLLDTFTITFDGEQWRNGVGSSTAANVLDFEYAVGVAPGGTIDGTGFTGDSGLDFTAPVTTSTEGALDGNTAGLTAGITKTISGISWAPGTDLIIRWTDINDTGNDDGLGIDNFTFSAATTAPNGSLSFSSPTYNVTENGVTATVTVNRVGNTAGAIGVTYSTVAGGTAVAGTDYTTTTGTLSWPAGNNDPQQFTIPITDNLTLNANKTINIALTNPTGGATLAGNTTGVVTIRENEQATQVLLNEIGVNPPTSNDRPWEFVEVRGTPNTTLGSYYVVQIDGGSVTPANAGNVWFLAELSNATMGSNGLLVVKAATGGHATTAPTTEVGSPLLDIANGRGLINSAQTIAIIFSPSGLSLDQDLDTNNDGTLDLPAGAVLVDSVGWKDNSDANAGLYAGFVYGGAEIYNEPYPLAGSGTPDAATRIYNNDTPNTAAAWFGGDIQDTGDPSSLTYDPAKATANLPIGAAVSPSIPNSGLSVSPASGSLSQNEGSTGTTAYTFNITRAGDLSAAVDVTWTVTGSGTNPANAADFENGVFPTGLASFAINEAVKQITINVVGDTDIEPTERFTVTLSNPTNGATLASPTANATIVNDDFQSFVAGDVVLTGINTTNPDQFSFVTLVALQPFSSINFTDNAYDANLLGFTTNEGVVTYTAPAGGLAAGTKVIIQVDGANVTVPSGGGTAALSSGSFGLNASGENLFAFSGTLLLPNVLFGLTTNTSYISTGTPTTSETYLPPALTIGTSAVAPFETTVSVNAQYTGATTGPVAALRALVADEANWTTSGTALTLSTTNFTISGPNQAPTDIALTGTTIAENAGANATVGTFSTTDPDDGNTFTYTLVSGTGSSGNAAFNISGNTLRATSSLDFETQNSYSIRVRTTDQGGAFYEEVFVITVTNVVEPLQVTSFTPTASGFVATFSEAFNPAEINLYGNAALGVADVTLVGASTGTIRGSLILNAANTRIEFVRTQVGATASTASGILPNDTYTVTLRSAGGTTTDGFNTAANVPLDGGVGDTAPGGEYTNTFVVNNPAGAVRVSLPDFTRGHGQDVNVPNTGTGLPLYISTGQNVSSLQMTMTYDPALLSITGFTLSSALQTAGVQATPNFTTPGVVILDITHTTELSSTAGALTLGTFTATVPTTATYGAKQVLDITSLTVFDNDTVPAERASIADDAVHVSAYFGDTSGNRQLQSNDGTLLARVNALLDTGFAAYQMADPTLIADISGNNQLQSNDGTLLARFNALIATPQIPAVPAAPVPLPGLAIDPVLAIGAPTTTPAAGSSFTVPLTLTVPASESPVGGVTSFSVLIEFDETKLTFVTNTGYSTVGTAAAGFGVTPNQIDNGATRTIVFDVQGGVNQTVGINPGETIILGYLTFSIPVGVTGSIDLNLLGSYQTVTTAVFDDSFSELFLTNGDGITPAPTNGFDPNNDLTINLGLGPNQAPTAVSVTPNPASIAENTAVPSNLLVGTISITDDGQGTNVLTLAGPDASFFTIVGNQLFLNAGTNLNFEVKNSYSVTVQVDDASVGGPIDATTSFTLNVTNVNEAPTIGAQTFSIAENSANGSVVGTVLANDVDAGDTKTFAITGGNTGGAFAINASTGEITVANSSALDFETTPTFSLTVSVTDGGGLSASAAVTVNLTDVFEAIAPIYINEIYWNPQGTDAPNEFIELRGTPGAVIPAGTYLIGIEGDAGAPNPGDVQNIFNLSGLTFGSNGLLLLLQKGSTYNTTAATTAGTTVVINTGTGSGWGSGPSSSLGHSADSNATDLENGSVTYMVVNSAVPPLLTDDIDADDDGTPDGTVYPTWTILDSIGALQSTAVQDRTYAAVNIKNGAGPGTSLTGTIVQIGGEVEYAARVVGSTTSTPADWIAGDTIVATPFRLALTATNITDGAYRGSPLDHIGLPNNFTLVAPTDIALTGNTIPENSAPGSTIGQFSTTDPTVGDTHTYTLVSGTGSADNAAFTLTTAGVLTINGSADFETKPSYAIRVRSTDAGGTFVEKEFTISVTNVNETPTDIALSNDVLAENAGANAVIGTLTGTDVDVPETLTFSLPVGVTDNGLFNISGNSLRANSSFDFEAGSSYTVTVRVTDAGGLFYDEAFPIIITDVNEAPVFGQASYSFSLAENSATGTSVGSVSATDQDAGASLTYSLSGTGSNNFEINPTTGAITVAAGATLNFEGTNTFNLTAGVTDGTNPVTAPVIISLTNVNEAPFFSPNTASFTIGENAANGTNVGTVSAQDPDAGDTRTYAITAGNGTGGGAFAINSTTGQITVADSAQMTAQTYTLTVTATDAGSLTGTITVTINVSANQPPVFGAASYGFSLAENSAAGTAVGSVSATDPELVPLTYSLAGSGSSNFAINSATGAITVAAGAVLDFEGVNTFNLTASASDGFLSVSVPVTISLTNVNEAPTITLGSSFSVPENSGSAGFATASSADPDGTTPTYSLSGPDAARFSINNAGLLAFLADPNFENPLDVGADNIYNLIVTASDGVLSASQAVAVTVTNVNEAPSFGAASYTFSILDTVAAVGSNVGTVTATDPDAGTTLTYTLSATGNGTAPGAFAINATTGQITVNDLSQINYFTTPIYSLTVSVSDGTNSVSVPVTVNITHTNQNPTFVSLSNNSVAENLPVGTAVGTFSTTDNDLPNDTHIYTLLTTGTGSTDHASFSIVGNQLRTNASFDYESKTSYTIRVRTTDQGGGSFERIFTIYVTDVAETGNQAPTNVALSGNHTVAPTGTTGTPVGNLSTTDPNPGDTFTYTLGGADAAKFQINGAVLRLASNVTDPVGTVYNISVTSTDQGGLFFTKNFAITVAIAPNVAPTYITLSANSVPENEPVNTVVGQFSTTDANPGDTFTYTLLTSGTGSTDHASFNIVGNQLRTSASFDYETKTSYTIRGRTTDQGGLSFERIFTVYVTNVVETGNQAPTNINLSSTTLAPAAAPGTTVGTLTTSDPNPGNTFTYALGGADAANFVINGNLLQVAPAAVIGPAGTSYSIAITSTDQGGLFFTKNFTISVAVAPNVAPTYLNLSNNKIAENAGANALVGTLSTTDANSGDTHTYTLVSGTGSTNNALFTIIGNELRAIGSFDYETKSSYTIRVRTTDQGGLWFERVLTIYVTDVPGA